MDKSGKEVSVDGREISLTPMEFNILQLLMEHPGKVYSSREIYELVWKDEPIGAEGVRRPMPIPGAPEQIPWRLLNGEPLGRRSGHSVRSGR